MGTYSKAQKEKEEKATLQSEIIFKGKLFNIRQDHLTFENEPTYHWDIIQHPGAVAILPIDQDGSLILIEQWRRAIGQIIYEIPAGTLHDREDPSVCAQRELQEEIGYKAKKLIPFGGLYASPGFCSEYIHLFIARDLIPSILPKDSHEAIDVNSIPLSKALSYIDSGKISDAKTIAVILRYARSITQS